MKRLLLVIALTIPVNALASGIPVFSAQDLVEYAQNIERWRTALEKAAATASTVKDTHKALTGITDLEDVLTSPLLWQFLPENFMEVYQQGIDMGLGSLFTEALDLYNTALSNDVCKWAGPEMQMNCQGRQTGGYNLMATSQKVFRNAERRQQQIDRLKQKQKTLELPKDREAVMAATTGEMASAQVELLTLQSMEMARIANEEMLEQKRSQIAYEVYDITESVELDPYVPGSLRR